MTSLILEARQQDGNSSRKTTDFNGQFVSDLKTSVTVENGDTLTLRNVFIDSAEQSTTISIVSPTTLTLEYIPFTTLTTDMKVTTPDSVQPNPPPAVDDQLAALNIWYSGSESDETWYQTGSFLVDRETNGTTGWGNGIAYCPLVRSTIDAEHSQVKSIKVYKNPFTYQTKWGDFTLHWYYRNTAGKTTQYLMHVPGIDNATNPQITYTVDFGTAGPIFRNNEKFSLFGGLAPSPNPNAAMDLSQHLGGGEIAAPGDWKFTNPDVEIQGPSIGGVHLTPVVNSRSIVIEPGDYSPSILANIISRKFNAVIGNIFNTGSVQTEVGGAAATITSFPPAQFLNPDTAFLSPAHEGGATLVPPTGGNRILTMASIDDSASLLDVYVDETRPGLLAGCANFEIDFDNDTQTFKMPKLHTEYHYNAGTTASPQYVEGVKLQQFRHLRRNPTSTAAGTDDDSTWTATTFDRGSIMLSGFSSSRADGKPSNFWTDELGFNKNMLVTPGSKKRENEDYYRLGRTKSGWNTPIEPPAPPEKLANVYYVPDFNFKTLEMGKQRTAPFLTAAVILPEGRKLSNYVLSTTANPGYGDPKIGGAPYGFLGIATTDTTSVFGTRSLQSILASDAFYKVVINGVPAARIHTSETISFISAIVGKYYSGQSYTNGFASDSITYVHQGAPVSLSSFDVNIFNSDDTPASIGPDNTIFLELTKAQPTGTN